MIFVNKTNGIEGIWVSCNASLTRDSKDVDARHKAGHHGFI